jgi:hypothetical protein
MKKSLLASILLISAFAQSSVILSLEGKVQSLTRDTVQVRTAKKIYSIDRKSLSADQAASLEKPNAKVALRIPDTAIQGVRALTKEELSQKY